MKYIVVVLTSTYNSNQHLPGLQRINIEHASKLDFAVDYC